jgi:hypothetical protein
MEVLVMSTPAPSSPSLHPTRRQLDELDALMERMLELPVNPVGDESKSSSSEDPATYGSPDASPFAGFSPHGMPSYQTEEAEALAADASRAFNFTTAGSIKGNEVSSGSGNDDFGQRNSRGVHIDTRSRIASTPRTEFDDAGPPPAIWLWPLVGMNQTYDTLMSGLGAPGRFMRGTGRVWLGWIGLLLLATALAWGVFDWLQWAG